MFVSCVVPTSAKVATTEFQVSHRLAGVAGSVVQVGEVLCNAASRWRPHSSLHRASVGQQRLDVRTGVTQV